MIKFRTKISIDIERNFTQHHGGDRTENGYSWDIILRDSVENSVTSIKIGYPDRTTSYINEIVNDLISRASKIKWYQFWIPSHELTILRDMKEIPETRCVTYDW